VREPRPLGSARVEPARQSRYCQPLVPRGTCRRYTLPRTANPEASAPGSVDSSCDRFTVAELGREQAWAAVALSSAPDTDNTDETSAPAESHMGVPTDGLESRYSRAVAVCGGVVLYPPRTDLVADGSPCNAVRRARRRCAERARCGAHSSGVRVRAGHGREALRRLPERSPRWLRGCPEDHERLVQQHGRR